MTLINHKLVARQGSKQKKRVARLYAQLPVGYEGEVENRIKRIHVPVWFRWHQCNRARRHIQVMALIQ